MRVVAGCFFGGLAVTAGACALEESYEGGSDVQALSTAAEGVRNHIIPRLPRQDLSLLDGAWNAEGLLPLRRENQPFLDLRGVGDSGDSGNRSPRAPGPALGAALDRLSPDGLLYRGDINVMNFETVVGERCGSYAARFGFLTSPRAIVQALDKGFQVFGLSNNHSRDCNRTPEAGAVADGGAGEITTAGHMAALESARGILWNGVVAAGNKQLVSVKEIPEGDRLVRVAFSSIDLGRPSCVRANCWDDRERVVAAFRNTEADVKIAMFHSREWLAGVGPAENRAQLDKIMTMAALLIERGGVHVAFGSGPHVAMPVRVLKRAGGGAGVAFLSLGNFIHPQLAAQSPNLVGRVLFDLASRRVVQVQGLMIATNGAEARPLDFEAASPFVGGLPWQTARDPSTGLKVGYVNVVR